MNNDDVFRLFMELLDLLESKLEGDLHFRFIPKHSFKDGKIIQKIQELRVVLGDKMPFDPSCIVCQSRRFIGSDNITPCSLHEPYPGTGE